MLAIILCIFCGSVWGLQEECLRHTFIGKSRESHPKWGVKCSDTEVENRWRGQLIYEKLEDNSGIRIKWKFLVQKPSCALELKFFMNNRVAKSIFPQRKAHNSDWVELTKRNNFELKVQALYYTEPTCFEAIRAITLNNKTNLNIGNKEAINGDEKPGEITPEPESGASTSTSGTTHFTFLPPIILPEFDEDGTMKKDENGTLVMEEETTQEVTTSTNSPMSENMIRTNPGNIDENDNTTKIAAGSVTATLVIIIIVVGAIIGRKRCRSSAALEQEDIDENRVYGIYSDDADDDDYIVIQDTCPDYEPADVI